MNILILILPTLQPLQEDPFGFRFGGWMNDMTGKVKSSTGLIPATDIDLGSTLGIDEPESAAKHATAWLTFPFVGRINLSYWSEKFEAENNIPVSILFAGGSYSQNSLVTTNIDLKMYGATLESSIMPILYFQIGSYFLSADVELSSPAVSSSTSVDAPIPVAGLRLGGELTRNVSIDNMLILSSISNVGNATGRFVDLRSELSIKLLASLAITGGYRMVNLYGKKEDSGESVIDVRIKGMFVGVGISF